MSATIHAHSHSPAHSAAHFPAQAHAHHPAAAAANPSMRLHAEPRVTATAATGMPKPYILGWLLLALVSLGYLAALTVRPDLVSEYLPLVASSSEQARGGKGATEITILRQTVADLRSEVSGLKTELLAHQERNAELTARLTTLEPKVSEAKPAEVSPAATAIARKFAEAKPAETSVPKAAETKPVEVKRLAVVAPPAAKTVPAPVERAAAAFTEGLSPLERQVLEGMETGSIAPPAKPDAAPVAFGAAVVTPAPKPIGIQIAHGASVDALRLSWSLLSDHHADSLKNLQPRVVTGASPDGGQTFDLVAGPLKSQAEAKKVCKALQSKNIACTIGSFEGEGL